MGEIILSNIQKTFKVAERSQGFSAAVKSFFSREYKYINALSDISFHIKPGELVGYIGPNGAGKSTTVKIMSGILVPDGGECLVDGIIPWKNRKEYVKNIGVVFGQRSQLWWDVPVIDSFLLLKDIYRIEDTQYETMKNDLIDRLNLSECLNRPVRQLSLGQRMRCELAASLLHNPSTLFLDEPTIGLDAVTKLNVREFIKEINQRYQTTVILTTHDMDDIEALCSRVIVIGKGSILFDGPINKLRSLVTEERRLTIDFQKPYAAYDIPHTTLRTQKGTKVIYGFNPEAVSASEIIQEASSLYEIKDILIENASIEEIIADLYEVFKL